jgi:UDPglucose--hexose-1-phosphate uridylyltransferase
VHREPKFCRFCTGHEEHTTAEVLARRDPSTPANSPGWRVRAVPNKYPAVSPSLEGVLSDDGLFASQPGVGVHEVFIESPEHLTQSSQLSAEQFADVLWIYRQRLCDVRQDKRLKYGLIFKNLGELSGASLEHLHSQMLATPMLPATVAEELRAAENYHRRRGVCLFCDVLAAELAAGERIVAETKDWVAFCPYASRFSWETWVAPRQHDSDFTRLSDDQLASLGSFFRGVLARIEATLPVVSYNYWLHTSPFDTLALEHYHWHMEILPRVTNVAGFEWGAGFAINTLSPEEAAGMLRQVS